MADMGLNMLDLGAAVGLGRSQEGDGRRLYIVTGLCGSGSIFLLSESQGTLRSLERPESR